MVAEPERLVESVSEAMRAGDEACSLHAGIDAAKNIWLNDFKFCSAGNAYDALLYVVQVLETVRAGNDESGSYFKYIGNIEGQQQFIFQWLLEKRLIESYSSSSGYVLTAKGIHAAQVLDEFGYDMLDDLPDD